MKITIKRSEKFNKLLQLDVKNVLEKAMVQVTLMVQNRAKVNAPYDTGTLKRSITSDFSAIKQWMTIVGSPVPYARIRHYQNFKNPHTLYYLERWYTEQESQIQQIITQALQESL